MSEYRIFDSLCYAPTLEVLVDMVVSLPPQMAPYLRDVFGARMGRLIGLEAEELYRMKTTLSPDELAEALRPRMKPLALSLDDFVSRLDEMGVEKAVLFNLDEETSGGPAGLPNDYYADLVAAYPDRFLGVAGVDPLKGMDAVYELRRAYDLGLRGAAVRPFMTGLPANHARMYPIYSTCVELGIPIWLHTSINYSTKSMEAARPIYIDVAAQDFPDLKIIAGHGGWPWVDEMMAVAWRNPNVYLDLSSYQPRYLARPGSGWEPLFNYGNSILSDKVLFASTWLLMGLSIKELADEFRTLPLKEEVKDKWLYHNAAALFQTG